MNGTYEEVQSGYDIVRIVGKPSDGERQDGDDAQGLGGMLHLFIKGCDDLRESPSLG